MKPRFFRSCLVVVAAFAFGCGGERVPASSPEQTSETNARQCNAPDCPSTTTAPAELPVAEDADAPEQTEPSDKDVPNKDATNPHTSDVPGANISIGRFEADGLVTKDIECKTEGGGMALLGMVLVTAWMAPQKKTLDACAPAGSQTRVVWKARGGKVVEIVAQGDSKVKTCVEQALRNGKPTLEGHCAATIVHGK